MQKGRPDRGGPSLVSDWRGQPWRVPVIAIEPNAPALIVPVSASPSIVASHSSVIGIGTFMFMVQPSLLPSTLPFSTSSAPQYAEHTSELQTIMQKSSDVLCIEKKKKH